MFHLQNGMSREMKQVNKSVKTQVKKAVAKVKSGAYDELYEKLDTKEGEQDLNRLAKQRDGAN